MLINERTKQIIARDVEVAHTRATRNRGLLGRARMDPGSARVTPPRLPVHTAFTGFAIDVLCVDRHARVSQAVRDLAPWRMAGACRARRVIEMPAGELDAKDVRVGDRLYLAN